jgi:hypothetical protein
VANWNKQRKTNYCRNELWHTHDDAVEANPVIMKTPTHTPANIYSGGSTLFVLYTNAHCGETIMIAPFLALHLIIKLSNELACNTIKYLAKINVRRNRMKYLAFLILMSYFIC